MSAQVTKYGALDIQVCVPAEWSNEQVIRFAETKWPCGTTSGWHIRQEGSPDLNGSPERVCCAERAGFIHIMLDA
jgi:hypothetical protein